MAPGLKTGGRKAGTPNKKTQPLQAKIETAGRVSPLDYMLSVMWDEGNPLQMRFDAAKAAAPYVHSCKVSAQIDARAAVGVVDMTPPITDEQRLRALAGLFAKVKAKSEAP